MLFKHYGLIIQEEAPTLYLVTCFIKLQKADSGGVVADSFTDQHGAILQRGHCESGWWSYRVNGTAGK